MNKYNTFLKNALGREEAWYYPPTKVISLPILPYISPFWTPRLQLPSFKKEKEKYNTPPSSPVSITGGSDALHFPPTKKVNKK
jgi:hypothetical protein